MAANFWTSSHYKRLLDPEYVDTVQSLDKDRGITVEDIKLIKMHMANCIVKLANQVKVRQRVVATAITYMRRLYTRYKLPTKHLGYSEYEAFNASTVPLCPLYIASNYLHYTIFLHLSRPCILFSVRKNMLSYDKFKFIRMFLSRSCLLLVIIFSYHSSKSMSEYEPRIVAPACLYLASKAEESTIQAKVVHYYMKRIYSVEKYRYEIKDILEMEMKILEALDFYLVVFHPYHSLTELLEDAGMGDKESIQFTWGLVNDTYKMDLILIYPPHMIALACIYIASVFKEKDTVTWFEELHVDMNAVKNISMEILDFYDSLKTQSEEQIVAAFNKLPTRQ